MPKIVSNIELRVIVLPVLGACGAVVALLWPVGHKAFCSGMSRLVL